MKGHTLKDSGESEYSLSFLHIFILIDEDFQGIKNHNFVLTLTNEL